MAAEFKHKRYFRVLQYGADSTWGLRTFSSTADANTKIGFKSAFNTSSPTKTEALENSGQWLVVTYEFDSESDQTAFKNAVEGLYDGDSSVFGPETSNDCVEMFRVEWLNKDGSVSSTSNLLDPTDIGAYKSPTFPDHNYS